jgi:uncharacterized protein HemX
MADCTTRLGDSATPCAVEPGAVLHFAFDTPKEKPVDPVAPAAAAPVAAAPAAPAAPVPPPTVADPATLTATTAPAPQAPTPADLGALAQQGGGGMVGVVLAIVAVAGGGAAWKFYSQRSEQAHELAKEKMKMEAQAAGLNGAQPPPCQAANVALEQKVTALTARVEAAEAKADAAAKKGAGLSADFDAEGLERQVKRLAKAVKELQEEKS